MQPKKDNSKRVKTKRRKSGMDSRTKLRLRQEKIRHYVRSKQKINKHGCRKEKVGVAAKRLAQDRGVSKTKTY